MGKTRDISVQLRELERLMPVKSPPAWEPPCEEPVGPEAFGAVHIDHPRGSYWRRTTRHAVDEPWGVARLDAPAFTNEGLKRLPFWVADDSKPESWAFVDCETTGLSGGAGTVAFLVAVGFIEQNHFVVEQFFLPDLSDECGMLCDLADLLDRFEIYWTYNGICFDFPLLEGRFRFWRMEPVFRQKPHNDLLYATRAMFRRRIGECTLGNVEARILKVARTEDLPGAEVPEVYFQYLRQGWSPRLFAVFEHNRIDVLTLGAYLSHLMRHFVPHPDEVLPQITYYPEDFLSLGQYLLRKGRAETALCALRRAEGMTLSPVWKVELSRVRALALKRLKRFPEADSSWEKVHGATDVVQRIEALIERAKHCEHRTRDFSAALRHVHAASVLSELDRQTGGRQVPDRLREALAHRRLRLHRRVHTIGNK